MGLDAVHWRTTRRSGISMSRRGQPTIKDTNRRGKGPPLDPLRGTPSPPHPSPTWGGMSRRVPLPTSFCSLRRVRFPLRFVYLGGWYFSVRGIGVLGGVANSTRTDADDGQGEQGSDHVPFCDVGRMATALHWMGRLLVALLWTCWIAGTRGDAPAHTNWLRQRIDEARQTPRSRTNPEDEDSGRAMNIELPSNVTEDVPFYFEIINSCGHTGRNFFAAVAYRQYVDAPDGKAYVWRARGYFPIPSGDVQQLPYMGYNDIAYLSVHYFEGGQKQKVRWSGEVAVEENVSFCVHRAESFVSDEYDFGSVKTAEGGQTTPRLWQQCEGVYHWESFQGFKFPTSTGSHQRLLAVTTSC